MMFRFQYFILFISMIAAFTLLSCEGCDEGGSSSLSSSSTSTISCGGRGGGEGFSGAGGSTLFDVSKLSDPHYIPIDESSGGSMGSIDTSDDSDKHYTSNPPNPKNPLIPFMSFSACAVTLDGISDTDGNITNGEKFENIFVNIKTDYLMPHWFYRWEQFGWKTGPEEYRIPVTFTAKVRYIDTFLSSPPTEREFKVTTPPLGYAIKPNDAKGTLMITRNGIGGQRFGFSFIDKNKIMNSGFILGHFYQQLWDNPKTKKKNKPSTAGPEPTIAEMTLKIPLYIDIQGNWHTQTVIFRNISVRTVLWGPSAQDYYPKGCYENLLPSTDSEWEYTKDFNLEASPLWSPAQWEVPAL